MSVLCGRYHVSLIAPGLSAGPCRVSNLLGFEQNSGGKEIVAAHGAGERQSDFLFAHLGMPSRPDLCVITSSGLGVSPGEQLKKGQKVGTGDQNASRRFFGTFPM